MELLEVSQQIQKKIADLEHARSKLKTYAYNKAKTMVDYERQLAIVIVGLKAGKEYNLSEDGVEMVRCEQATNIKDVARGVCYQESLDASVAEALYKNCIVQIDAIKAELNGWQSINRYLESTT